MEFPANDVQVLYTKFQDDWNLHISLPHSRNLNYYTVPSYWTSGIGPPLFDTQKWCS